jgi:glycosyltransferase involved in cell wall biosynthesis
MIFTVVIATCNRPDRLSSALLATIEAIRAMDDEQAVIVVVDNGPEVSAKSAVDDCIETVGFPITYVQSESYNKAAALNAGIAVVSTPWVAFTDDDCLPDREWLLNACRYIERFDVGVFSGRLEASQVDFALPRWLDNEILDWSPAFVDFAPYPESGLLDTDERVPFGANIFVKKDVFEKFGGYDEELWHRCGSAALGSEDAEFAIRVRAHETIGYCAEALVMHPVSPERTTIRYYLNHIFQSGVREPLFCVANEQASTPYLVKTMSIAFGHACFAYLRREYPQAMRYLMDAARDVGEVWGKLRVLRSERGIHCDRGDGGESR